MQIQLSIALLTLVPLLAAASPAPAPVLQSSEKQLNVEDVQETFINNKTRCVYTMLKLWNFTDLYAA